MADYDIHKAAGIIIRNRKLLVARSKGKDVFVAPGGKLEKGETPEQALVRELEEELGLSVTPDDFEIFGTFYAVAAGSKDTQLRMDVYLLSNWQGEPTPSAEIEDLEWVTSDNPKQLKQGSIFEHDVIPQLKSRNLID